MTEEKQRMKVDPDLDFVQDIMDDGGETLKKCFQCGTCSVVCNLAPEDGPFPRKEMIWAQWGMKDKLVGDPSVWLCHQCGDCTTQCPRGAKPGEVLGAIRKKIIESVAVPRLLGKMVGDPQYLPVIFGVPALILLAIVLITGTADMAVSPVVYGKMIGHLEINALFIPLAGLAGLAFLVGLNRIWTMMSGKDLVRFAYDANRPRLGQAAIDVVMKIINHQDFDQCDANKWRRLAHMMVLFGFIGLLIVTALAIVVLVAVEYLHWTGLGDYPMNWYHPIKWLALVSAAALIIGSGLMIANRRKLGEAGTLSSSYFDNFFLYVIFFVGVTGFLAWILRIINIAPVAYPVYYVHLVLVFSLLIYSPYSKFAHFFYRSAVLVYLRYQELGKAQPEKAEAAAHAEPEAA